MTIWTPRDYQRAARDFALDQPRVNLWMGTGTGKGSTGLAVFEHLRFFGEANKLLVISTKRVAQHVWPAEVAKWENFAHLSIATAIGTPDQRLDALRRDANITTINIDNVPWLIDTIGEHWPWDIVFADESSKLKNLRIDTRVSTTGKIFLRKSGGSERAQRLAKIAHKKIRRWLNLTGTPASNGLIDLYGQAWYLDAGQRLGRTFTAFRSRWFRQIKLGDAFAFRLEPWPHADAEIKAALSDITLTIEAKDYFDLPPTVVNVIPVRLPPKAYAHYQEMEKEMFTEIQTHDVEAVNSGAKGMKLRQLCLAEGTPVLTDAGWIPIERVTSDHRVWDGQAHVYCGGAIQRGLQPVVDCAGVLATGGHRFMTATGWRTAQEINDADAHTRLDWPDVRLPDSRVTPARQNEKQWRAMVGAMRLRETVSAVFIRAGLRAQARSLDTKLRLPAQREAKDTWHDKQPAVSYLVKHAIALLYRVRQRLSKLWCKRNPGLRGLAEVFRCVLGRHVAYVRKNADAGADKQRRRVFAQELPVGDNRRAIAEQTNQPLDQHPRRKDDNIVGSRSLRLEAGNAVREDKPLQVGRDTRIARTYDLIDCGPRHCFAVRGSNGQVMLSHNCNGAAYTDVDGSFVVTHDEKIEALRDIIGDLAGEPLIVAYQFKSDLARLRKAFPEGRYFDDSPATLADFVAGRTPLLFLHPQSAAHGIDGMQDHCRNIAWFSMTWNLEDFEQANERIGATRQVQAGHYRTVFVHLLVGVNTIEEEMVERVKSKASVQDAVKAAMKKRSHS